MEKENAEFGYIFKVESVDSHDCLEVEGEEDKEFNEPKSSSLGDQMKGGII